VLSDQTEGLYMKKRYAKKNGAVSAIALTKRGGRVTHSK
jgi:hypothetical protein